MFSSRTDWQRKSNRLTDALNERKRSGKTILDLTNSNPTACGIAYPVNEILRAFSSDEIVRYQPDPQGLLSARNEVCKYYSGKGISLDPSQVFLTASTSEAYLIVFKLLCNVGDNVLVPQPSYPLFDYLAQINDVELKPYSLRYDGEWRVDLESLKHAVTKSTRAIVLIHPHNPTGMFLKNDEFDAIQKLASQNNLALIVDEVFSEYAFSGDPMRLNSAAAYSNVLSFTLNGISKMLGLPQMKLGWIAVTGPEKSRKEASARLEIICDTFLSVNTPVQVALPELMRSGLSAQKNILERVKKNYVTLAETFPSNAACSALKSEGGWYGILRVPRTKRDEDRCLELLEKEGVLVHPGYYYDFEEEGYLVLSLLTEEKVFEEAAKKIAKAI